MNKRMIHLKIMEMRKALDAKQYSKALKVLDTMNWDKIREINYLNLGIEVLEKNEQYSRAKKIIMELYDRKVSKRVLASLVRISMGLRELDMGAKYLEEFKEKAPFDMDYYILRYQLHKTEKRELDALLEDLEEIKRLEYMEKWGYELAKIYHKVGDGDKCIKECDRIILWFGEGLYVDKARLLKEYYNYGADIEEFVCTKPYIQNKEDAEEVRKEVKEEDIKEEDIKEEDAKEEDAKEEDAKEEEIKEENIDIEIIKKVFEGFFEIAFFKEEILSLFKEIRTKGFVLPVIIIGESEYGRKDFMKKLLTASFQLGYIKSSQIAKIKAERLNNGWSKGKILEFLEKGLVIENASNLNQETLEKLIDVMIENREKFVIIFESEDAKIEELITLDSRAKDVDYYMIHIPEYY